MAVVFINGVRSTPVSPVNGDSYVLGSGSTHYKADGPALFYATGAPGDIVIFGDIYTASGDTILLQDSEALGGTILVTAGGNALGGAAGRAMRINTTDTLVTNLGTIAAGTGIEADGNGVDIINHGLINSTGATTTGASGLAGVRLDGADSYVENMGTIRGNIGIDANAAAMIVNSGAISGFHTGIDYTANAAWTLTNSGTIAGDTGVSSAGTGAATIRNSGTIEGETMAVTLASGNDTIVNHGVIEGRVALGSGNDVYRGRFGTITDSVNGGAGMDTIKGGAQAETLLGGNGADHVVGYGGDDMIDGGNGADHLMGRGGDDHIIGGVDNDTLHGGRGDDTLDGGAGTDTFVFSLTHGGHDRVLSFQNDIDVLDFSAFGVKNYNRLLNTYNAVDPRTDGVIFDLTKLGGDGSVYVMGIGLGDLNGADFLF